MARRELRHDFTATDNLSRTIKGIGNEADKAADKLDDTAKATKGLDEQMAKTSKTVADLRKEIAETGDTSLFRSLSQAENELKKLERVKDHFRKTGDESAVEFGVSFSQRIGPLLAKAPIGPHMATAMAAAAPAAVAVLAAAISGGVAVAGVGAGVALAAKSPEVKAAAAGLGAFIGQELTDAAKPFVPATLDAIETVRQGFADLRPEFEGIFADAAPFLGTLTEGAVGGMKELVPALRDVVRNADPVVDVIGSHLTQAADAAGTSLRLMSQDSEFTAQQLDKLLSTVEGVVVVFGGLVAGVNKAGEAKDGFIKKLGPVGGAIETALFPLEPGIRKLGEWGKALANDDEKADAAAVAHNTLSQSMVVYQARVDGTLPKIQGEAAALQTLTDRLRTVHDISLSAAEAKLSLRQATDAARAAADKHKGVSATEEGALLSLARSTNTTTGALERAGATTGELTAHSAATRAEFIRVAQKMGYTKTQAEQLASKYLAVPKGVSTTVSAPGLSKAKSDASAFLSYARDLDGMVVRVSMQTSGFVGPTGAAAFKSAGGPVYGPGAKGVDSVRAVLAPGEHVFTAPEVDAMGGQQAVTAFRRNLMSPQRSPASVPGRGGGDEGWRAVVKELRALPIVRLDTGRTADIYRRTGG